MDWPPGGGAGTSRGEAFGSRLVLVIRTSCSESFAPVQVLTLYARVLRGIIPTYASASPARRAGRGARVLMRVQRVMRKGAG